MKGITMHTNASIMTDRNISTDRMEHPDLETPVLSESQRQGDVLVRRIADASDIGELIPAKGITVVKAETNSANTHTLHTLSGECFWSPNSRANREDELVQGWLTVGANSEATLIHTEEHNVLGLGPGTYEIRRQREFAGEWRQVAD